jgi:hypothetical protein
MAFPSPDSSDPGSEPAEQPAAINVHTIVHRTATSEQLPGIETSFATASHAVQIKITEGPELYCSIL